MPTELVLLCTDIEGSTQVTERLGDAAASALWAEHDRIARGLLPTWSGHEIDKSDGFLLVFTSVDNAVGYACDMHRALASLNPPLLTRAGIHVGPMVERENTSDAIALGAKPVELDGVAKSIAARIQALALGGQTLLSAPARGRLTPGKRKLQSHGHWRMKGLAEPIELFEVGDETAPFLPPPHSAKSYRVVLTEGGWKPVDDLPHSLPAERDRFVGRRGALTSLASLFDGDARLVTVLGIGGIGKTRLVVRYARQWLGDFPGGAWFCDLSLARGFDGIVHGVAQGLDVPLGNADPLQQLGAAIAGRGECLIILDNFEQVARHAEVTLGHWLERAPLARLIVTSREVLGIPGEEAFVLAPLQNDEAVDLFERRALAADNGYAPPASERADVPKLVDLLDRLPLAIELAAARVRVMSPRAMLERMGQRFKLLASTGGRRERQATLRTTLDWSWELLSPGEQSALAQLSVFEGGFSLNAAEAVVDLSALPDAPWLADLMQGLIEKSLLRHDGSHRFELLRGVQDYAAERLEAMPPKPDPTGRAMGVQSQARQRHWQYFAALTETAATAQRCIETENLIAACRRAAPVEPGCAVDILQLVWAVLRLTGPFRVALTLVALVEKAADLSPRQHAQIDAVAGAANWLLGEVEQANARFATGLEQALVAGEPIVIAKLRCLIADLEITRGQLQRAEEQLDEAMKLAVASRDVTARFLALYSLGALHMRQSRLLSATERYTEAMKLAMSSGNGRWQGGVHGNLGSIALLQGRLVEAKDHYSAGLELVRDMGDRQWEGNTRCNLGYLLHQLGDEVAARAELEAALLSARSIGHRRLEATVLCNLGIVLEAIGEADEALRLYSEAVDIAHWLADPRFEAEFRGYLGLLLARLDRPADSEACFDLALKQAEDDLDPSTLPLICCQRARAAICRSDEAARKLWCGKAEALIGPVNLAVDSDLGNALAKAKVPCQ